MPLKINGASTGSVTLAAPATGSDVTLNLPSSNATIATTANTYTFDGVSPSNRNKIINGDFSIWQRNTSFSIAASSGYTYTADRWGTTTGANQAITVSRQLTSDTINLPNLQYCLRYQRNSGQTGTSTLWLYNNFESVESIKLASRTVTLSFWARRGSNYSATSNILVSGINTGTGTDQAFFAFTSGSVVGATSHTLTTTWQRFSSTVTLGSNITQIAPYFQFTPTGTASTNDFFEVAGVQLELGSNATYFEFESFGDTLRKCQRYYEKSYNQNVFPGTASTNGMFSVGSSWNTGAITGTWTIPYKVDKRSSVTFTYYSSNSGASGVVYNRSGGSLSDRGTGLGGFSGGTSAFVTSIGSGVGITAYLPTDDSFIQFQWTADAEL